MRKATKAHIETGISTPIRRIRQSAYPFEKLPICKIEDGKYIGDCLFIGTHTRNLSVSLAAAIFNFESKHPDIDLTQIRCEDGNIRVYRIK